MHAFPENPPMESPHLHPSLQGRLDNPLWRLNHLYWIESKSGHMQRFRLNAAQNRLHRHLWNRNAVLKARQLGISTYVAMLMLDRCLFTPNYHAGIIDKTLPDAEQKLEKIRFAWEHLDYVPPGAAGEEKALAYVGALLKQRSGVLKKTALRPVADARTLLQEYPDIDRSCYAGYLGPWGHGAVQLYVSLRCMQIFPTFCRLYAGGGLMPDSDEEQEWQETENKMACMRQAIEGAYSPLG